MPYAIRFVQQSHSGLGSMTKFVFQTVGKAMDEGLAGRQTGYGPEENSFVVEAPPNSSLQDKLYFHASRAIGFLQSNNLVPPLPEQVNVVFTNVSIKEQIAKGINSLLGKRFEQYEHNACADPESSTIYMSSVYLKHAKRLPAELQALSDEFGGDVQKILERELFHEIGHLIIREHLPRKEVKNFLHPFEQRIRNNLEEGFADSFSLHMMACKYPNHQSFPMLRKHLFQDVQSLEELEDGNPLQEISVYRVYDDIPLKDINGVLIVDIKEVVEKCLEVSLKNNKAMLLECLADNFHCPKVKNSMSLNFSGSDSDYVDFFHNQYKREGIVVSIRDLRVKHFGSKRNVKKPQ